MHHISSMADVLIVYKFINLEISRKNIKKNISKHNALIALPAKKPTHIQFTLRERAKSQIGSLDRNHLGIGHALIIHFLISVYLKK